MKIPFFAKLTPNVTEIRVIAKAAYEGGATGVTAINTISGLMGLKGNGEPWPGVGQQLKTTYGGVSGNATRPVALRDVSAIANMFPKFPIMAAGGVDSADVALQFLSCGAGVVQICSAIQNQDFAVIQDYITGLKALLYLQARKDLKGWDGQSPPLGISPSKAIPQDPAQGKSLPHFGPYERERRRLLQEYFLKKDLLSDVPSPRQLPSNEPAPHIEDVLGRSLQYITNYNSLNNKEQVVAIVNEELCINCGRCYQTCNDSAYQAIKFDPKTHLPKITDDCTGCAMCISVCPIIDCITVIPRTTPYVPTRGAKSKKDNK